MVAFNLREDSDLKNEVHLNNTYKTWVSTSQKNLISITITSIRLFSMFSEVNFLCSEKHRKREDLIKRLELLIVKTGATCKYDSAINIYR